MSVLKYKNPSTGVWEMVGNATPPYTDEQVRDVVAAFVIAGPNMSIAHDDPGNTLTFTSTGGGGGGGGSGNIDGGSASSIYGGTDPIDGGDA